MYIIINHIYGTYNSAYDYPMNLQVGPKPYTLIESLQIPLKGPL